MVEFKIFQLEKVLNIFKIPGDQVVHTYHMHAFFNEAVAKMGTQKSGSARYENYFFCHCRLFYKIVEKNKLLVSKFPIHWSTPPPRQKIPQRCLKLHGLPSYAFIIEAAVFHL